MARIYMDNHATTPVDPRVLEAMMPFFREQFGNAASGQHSFGRDAEKAVEKAREQVASLIHAAPEEIVFTSGATESNNLAIKGAVAAAEGDHVVTVATEHRSVLDPCRAFQVTELPVRKDGSLDLDELRGAITDRTVLVSVMHANNEIGVVHPIPEIGRICRERGVLFHTDAAQSVGKIPFDAQDVDLASLSAHKIYGPKGVGALSVRRRKPRARLVPQIEGGGHERGLRSGTLPVPLIVGFGEACAIAERERAEDSRRLLDLREKLRKAIFESLDLIHLNGSLENRLPGNLNISFEYVEGESLLMGAGEVALSSGSACTTAQLEPSHVLCALGVREDLVRSSIRFGLGRFNSEEDVEIAAKLIVETVRRLRKSSPLYEMMLEENDPKR